MQRVLVSQVEQPASVVLAALEHDCDRLLDSSIRLHGGCPQVVKRAEDVVVPQGRKRELRPALMPLSVFDHLASRQPSEQTALEEILLRALPSVCHCRRGTERLLEREQSFEHTNRRVE